MMCSVSLIFEDVPFNRLPSLEIPDFKCVFFLLLISSLQLLLETIWNGLIFNYFFGLT